MPGYGSYGQGSWHDDDEEFDNPPANRYQPRAQVREPGGSASHYVTHIETSNREAVQMGFGGDSRPSHGPRGDDYRAPSTSV